ncbi:hypothetical protein BBJ29_009814 [Phytophthora kernoviae]|uniref:BZIP domain-containing protein n=1 Tax=Phytophthora kernoviae TaxID=325452 RepID=A0A3F2RBB3_9STRA|nr:hypothetical protein BBP00_00009900 [Phytophthora kernoviae]RLN71664.1 hypothetical protein BBJ29_009814 [Phytophthora kernoviae]
MRGKGKVKVLWFKNTRFHRIIPGFMMQGGDITHGNGAGGAAVVGASFEDEEADAFAALPLLDFESDDTLLSPAEQHEFDCTVTGSTCNPLTPNTNLFNVSTTNPSSPVSTDDGSTDAEVASPPSAFTPQTLPSRSETDASSFFSAARMSLLVGSSSVSHSPLPSDQKLLPRTSNNSVISSRSSSSMASTPAASVVNTVTKPMESSKSLALQTSFPGALPYALPVAYFPPLNANQKRPFPQVLPGVAPPGGAATSDDSSAKKSKREIRQMKNRESANKSRLRRKAQLSSLSTEVEELTKNQQELQTVIASLRAENKSLHDQNAFLRSLVTGFKQEPSSSSTDQVVMLASLPPVEESVALNMLESGQKMEVDGEEHNTAGVDFASTRPAKRRSVTSTLSTASMAVCASVFGITVFADYDGGVGDSGNVRGVGRVLHEAPSACGVEGCAPGSPLSLADFVLTAVSSWWQFVSSSELVFGVLLNVLSFIAIMTVYQLWQSNSTVAGSWKYRSPSKPQWREAEWSWARCLAA